MIRCSHNGDPIYQYSSLRLWLDYVRKNQLNEDDAIELWVAAFKSDPVSKALRNLIEDLSGVKIEVSGRVGNPNGGHSSGQEIIVQCPECKASIPLPETS